MRVKNNRMKFAHRTISLHNRMTFAHRTISLHENRNMILPTGQPTEPAELHVHSEPEQNLLVVQVHKDR